MSAETILQGVAVGVSVATAVAALAAGLRSGVLKRVRVAGIEFEALEPERKQAKALIEAVSASNRDVPFETEQLAQYYAQVLAQSKVSFWFSLIFASLGFAVIIFAVFHQGESTAATTVQALAGLVIDAVAALFFAQSKAAQTSMSEFFEKLRRDRQQAESRQLCESIHNPPDAKDALKIQLALYYAGMDKSEQVANAIVAVAFGISPKTTGEGQAAGKSTG